MIADALPLRETSQAVLGSDPMIWAGLAVFLLLNAVLLYAWVIALAGVAEDRFWVLVGACAGLIAQVVGGELILGWLGLLRPLPLVLLELALSAGLVWLAGGFPPSRRWLVPFQWLADLRRIRIPIWAWLVFALLAAMAARNAVWAWILPPYHRDDIAYHLPIVATIVQSGALEFWESPSIWVRSYPVHSELWQAWFCLFTGGDKLADAAFLPPVLLGGAALYGAVRALGGSRRGSLLAAALFFFTPVTILQAGNSYNDAWLAALFFAGVCLLLRGSRFPPEAPGRRATRLLVFALAGILAGSKYLGLLWGGLLILLDLAVGWMESRRRGETNAIRPAGAAVLAVGLAVAAFFAAYPYVRNWIRAGNPLAPAEVRIAGWTVFPGRPAAKFLTIGSESIVESGPWQEWVLPLWMDRKETLFDPNNAGVGPFWFALGWIILPAGFAVAGPRRDVRILLLAAVFFGMAVTPTNWRPRYDLPILLAGGIALAALHDASGTWARRALTMLAIASAAYAVWALSIPLPVKPAQAAALARASSDLDRSAARLADANELYLWVDAETRDRPAAILYGEHLDFYPLYGSDFRNRLIHAVPGDAREWAEVVRAESVDLIVVASGSAEEEWTRALEGFSLRYEQDGLVVYARD